MEVSSGPLWFELSILGSTLHPEQGTGLFLSEYSQTGTVYSQRGLLVSASSSAPTSSAGWDGTWERFVDEGEKEGRTWGVGRWNSRW